MALSTNGRHASIKFTRFYMRVVGFWYAESKREQWMLYGALTYTIAAVLFAIGVEGVDFYYSWGDFDAVTYNACCTMALMAIACKVIVFMIRRDVVMDLILFSEKNFWETTYDDFGESILQECERRGILLFYTLSFTVQSTALLYITAPMIENIGVMNDTDRNLPFRLWVNFPIKQTPYYEITYTIQSLSTVHSGICFFCFDNLMSILNIHVVGQFKILQHRLEKLCDQESSDQPYEQNSITKMEQIDCKLDELQGNDFGLDEKAYCELKKCVKQHIVLIDYVEKLEEVFNLILLCQMGLSSIFMCLGGFQIFVADLSTLRRVIFVCHMGASLSQLLLFTWTCNEIIVHSEEVAEAAFRSKWYTMPNTKAGRAIRHALIMVMVRARRACYLSAGKFGPVSLQAFTSILSTTVSYYTLLRQISEKE